MLERVAGGEAAIALAEQTQPDVVLMDIHMPDVNGIEATRRIVQTSPHIRVLMLTMFEDEDRAQPYLEHFQQATGRRSGAGDCACA